MTAETRAGIRLGRGALRWCCDGILPDFETTREVEPITGVVGQDDAIDALRYGLELFAPGQNIYVRGIAGTGRMTLVRQLLEDISPTCPQADDRAYVHNFAQPGRPRLITLPRGRGRDFRDGVDRLIEFVEDELAQTLNSDSVRAKRAALDAAAQQVIRDLGAPFEKELRAAGLALVTRQAGGGVQPDILPAIDGEPVPLERLEALEAEGKVETGEVERLRERIADFAVRLEDVNHQIGELRLDHRQRLRALLESETRRFLGYHIEAIESEFDLPAVREFLADVVADLVQRLGALERISEATRKYRVNPLLEQDGGPGCPIVIENTPTLRNLLGEIEREFVSEGGLHADHMMIQAGSLLQADGGFLILEARDVLAEPGAWKTLLRSLRAGTVEIVPAEFASPFGAPFLKPDPIPISVKVVLIGDGGLYEQLSAADPDFGQLFKVLADFETTIARDRIGASYYAGVISRIARDEGLLPFSRDAVVALVDHGARIAGRRDRLTTRFGRLADIAREAAFLAGKAKRRAVAGGDVAEAIRRGRRRADLPARRFRQMIAEGTIGIRTRGTETGQVNGLAVVSTGPLTYGFPQRITATVGPGSAGRGRYRGRGRSRRRDPHQGLPHPGRAAATAPQDPAPARLLRLDRLRAELWRDRRRFRVGRRDLLPAERAHRGAAAPGPRDDRRHRPARPHPARRRGDGEDRGVLRGLRGGRAHRHPGRDRARRQCRRPDARPARGRLLRRGGVRGLRGRDDPRGARPPDRRAGRGARPRDRLCGGHSAPPRPGPGA